MTRKELLVNQLRQLAALHLKLSLDLKKLEIFQLN